MGSVKFETVGEGRGLHEWDYLSFGEPRTVKAQIVSRSKVDATYYMKLGDAANGPWITQGVTPMSEPIICAYIDLDRLVETCGLSKAEMRVVKYLMRGYCLSDIAEHMDVTRATVATWFGRAVGKIVRQNNKNWKDSHYEN